MEYQEHYNNMVERNSLCDAAEARGFRMLHDNFDPDWKRGDEPHGTLIFTDMPAPVSITEPVRNLAAEIDEINTRVKTLEINLLK